MLKSLFFQNFVVYLIEPFQLKQLSSSYSKTQIHLTKQKMVSMINPNRSSSVLTHRQRYRRANISKFYSYSPDRNENLFIDCADESIRGLSPVRPEEPRSFVDESFIDRLSNIIDVKRVRFKPKIRVYFIPNRKQLASVMKDIFWRQEDFEEFKQDAIQEIRIFWKNQGGSIKDAIAVLYQPNPDVDYEHFAVSEKSDEIAECSVLKHVDSLSFFSSSNNGISTDNETDSVKSTNTIENCDPIFVVDSDNEMSSVRSESFDFF